MEITVAGQTWMFLYSIVLGAALGVCYDVFRIIRIAVPNPPSVILAEDILFSVICAVATLLYLIVADCGQIRVFVLIGELVGFALYYCTVGALVVSAAKGIIAAVRWVLKLLFRIFVAPLLRVTAFLRKIIQNLTNKAAKRLKSTVKNSNMPLKKHSDLLYNLKKRLLGKRQQKNLERQDKPVR